MPVSKSEYVPYHRHDSQTASETGSPFEPDFRVLTLHPEYFLNIFSYCLLKGISEYFNLVDKGALGEVLAHLVDQFEFNILDDASFRPVVFDQLVKRISVIHPSDKPSILTQGDDWHASNRQLLLGCLRVDGQKRVYQAKKLHDSLVLPDIFVAFKQKEILLTISAVDGHFPGMLLRLQYRYVRDELLNLHDWLVTLERTRDGDLQVFSRQKLGRYVAKLIELNVFLKS